MTELWTYSEEAQRICGSVAALHLQLREFEMCLAGMPYNMVWKRSGAREYLYRVHDRKGNGASLGRRSPETEGIHRRFLEERAAAQLLIAHTEARIAEAARIYRALSLPMLAPAFSRVLDAFEAWDIDYWAIGSVGVMAVSTLLGLHVDGSSLPDGEDAEVDLDLVIHPSQVERVDGMFPDMTQIWTGGETPRITFRDRRCVIDVTWPAELVEVFSRGATTVQVLVTRDLRTAAVRIPEAGALMAHDAKSRGRGRSVVPDWMQDLRAVAAGRAHPKQDAPPQEGGDAVSDGPRLSHDEARRLMAPRIRSLRSAHGGAPGPHAMEIIAGRGAPPPPADGNDGELPADWHTYMERTA